MIFFVCEYVYVFRTFCCNHNWWNRTADHFIFKQFRESIKENQQQSTNLASVIIGICCNNYSIEWQIFFLVLLSPLKTDYWNQICQFFISHNFWCWHFISIHYHTSQHISSLCLWISCHSETGLCWIAFKDPQLSVKSVSWVCIYEFIIPCYLLFGIPVQFSDILLILHFLFLFVPINNSVNQVGFVDFVIEFLRKCKFIFLHIHIKLADRCCQCFFCLWIISRIVYMHRTEYRILSLDVFWLYRNFLL